MRAVLAPGALVMKQLGAPKNASEIRKFERFVTQTLDGRLQVNQGPEKFGVRKRPVLLQSRRLRSSMDRATSTRVCGTSATQATSCRPTQMVSPTAARLGKVLNIAYLNKAAVDRGGFFPTGVNSAIKLSAASA